MSEDKEEVKRRVLLGVPHIDYKPVSWEPMWDGAPEDFIEDLNKRHFITIIGGQTRVGMMVTDRIDNTRDRLDFVSPEQWCKLHCEKTLKITSADAKGDLKERYILAYPLYVKSARARRYHGGVTFRPAAIGREADLPTDTLNLWQGFGVQPRRHDGRGWEFFNQYIHELCSGEEPAARWILAFIKDMLTQPERKHPGTIVMRGSEGTGKTSLHNLIAAIIGPVHSMLIGNKDLVVGRFNGHFADKLFATADEACFAGSGEAQAKLKALTGARSITVERKGVDAEMMRFYTRLMLITNDKHAVQASKESRRWLVVNASEARKGDQAYWREFSKALEDRAMVEDFVAHLLEEDLSDCDMYVPPRTEALREQQELSLDKINPVAMFLQTAVAVGDLRPDSVVHNKRLFDLWTDYAKSLQGNRIKSINELGKAIERYLGASTSENLSDGTAKGRGRRLPSFNEMNRCFIRETGVALGDPPAEDEEDFGKAL